MMHLFINSLAASAGGGLTYVRNVIPQMAMHPDLQVTAALSPALRKEFPSFPNVDLLELDMPATRRFWYEQTKLPDLIRRTRADVLLSAGNFALRNTPVPQILLSRNSIYTSGDFYRDLRLRHEYKAWFDTHLRAGLAKRSIRWADVTIAPSEAFAAELTRWAGKPVRAIYHGFDREAFTRDLTPLDAELEQKLRVAEESIKLLFVSHYNYYRNFETLIRALPPLRDRLGRPVKLLLTCKLVAGESPGAYNPERAANLIEKLGVSDMVIELGAIPHEQLHQLYRRANLYVTPAYTETFAHPLVESMASALPVVASDLPVHREICGDAALYFARFSCQELVDRVCELATVPEMATRLSASGVERSTAFSWKRHVDTLLAVARTLVGSRR